MGDRRRSDDGDACGLLKFNCEVSKVPRSEKENGRGFAVLITELPRYEDGGGPAGVKDADDEGGGPAGVVEACAAKEKTLSPWPDRLSGVDGGLEEKGTWKPDMAGDRCCPSYWIEEQKPSK